MNVDGNFVFVFVFLFFKNTMYKMGLNQRQSGVED